MGLEHWNTLQEKISQHADARKTFDPDYGPFSERILSESQEIKLSITEGRAELREDFSAISSELSVIKTLLAERRQAAPNDATVYRDALEAHLDADIDIYRDMAIAGRPRTALPLLEGLFKRVQNSASGRLRSGRIPSPSPLVEGMVGCGPCHCREPS